LGFKGLTQDEQLPSVTTKMLLYNTWF